MFFNKFLLVVAIFLVTSATFAQQTEFTYQGSLRDGANAATGSYDFEFRIFDSVSGGLQLGSLLTRPGVSVSNGIFAVSLDFGFTFPGANRYLDIRVRNAGGGSFTPLDPRQKITTAPYAIRSVSSENSNEAQTAATANNALALGGVAANQFVVTSDSRLIDARPPTAGSANYIQNGFLTQSGANFNISGTGTTGGTLTGNAVNSLTQYNLNGSRVLGNPGTNNFFAGNLAGALNTGSFNSFFGRSAGQNNGDGSENAFFGESAGLANTSGDFNAFFGRDAGRANTTAIMNTFFGHSSGSSNTSGTRNAFFGQAAGEGNMTGEFNSFFGWLTGRENTTGSENSFFGKNSGRSISTGRGNTMIGHESGGGSANLRNATAIGSRAFVGSNDSLVLGSISGVNGCSLAVGCDSVNVGIGTATPSDTLHVNGTIRLSILGAAGGTTLCRNASQQISTCSSSRRYKTNLGGFTPGLALVKRLKPITFDWKEDGLHDFGLGAEDVAAIEPLLVTYNAKGEVEGVKYDRIGVVLVNAVKEQQTQIDAQRAEISDLKEQVNLLRHILCKHNEGTLSAVCKAK